MQAVPLAVGGASQEPQTLTAWPRLEALLSCNRAGSVRVQSASLSISAVFGSDGKMHAVM